MEYFALNGEHFKQVEAFAITSILNIYLKLFIKLQV